MKKLLVLSLLALGFSLSGFSQVQEKGANEQVNDGKCPHCSLNVNDSEQSPKLNSDLVKKKEEGKSQSTSKK